MRKKAAEELKREQERKAEERRKIIRERTGQPRNSENANEGKKNLLILKNSFFCLKSVYSTLFSLFIFLNLYNKKPYIFNLNIVFLLFFI